MSNNKKICEYKVCFIIFFFKKKSDLFFYYYSMILYDFSIIIIIIIDISVLFVFIDNFFLKFKYNFII